MDFDAHAELKAVIFMPPALKKKLILYRIKVVTCIQCWKIIYCLKIEKKGKGLQHVRIGSEYCFFLN